MKATDGVAEVVASRGNDVKEWGAKTTGPAQLPPGKLLAVV
jgi:hypothetical protein